MTEDNRITAQINNTNQDQENMNQDNQNDNSKGQNEVEMPTPQKENKEITTGTENEGQNQNQGQQNQGQQNQGQQNQGQQNQGQQSKDGGVSGKAGFQPEQTSNKGNENKDSNRKSDETERKDRETAKPTFQNTQNKNTENKNAENKNAENKNAENKNADWTQDKLNEANNEKGGSHQGTKPPKHDNTNQGTSVDEKGKPHEKNQTINKEANVSDREKGKGKLGDTRRDSITDRPKTETYEKKTDNDTWKSINSENRGHTAKEQKRETQNKR